MIAMRLSLLSVLFGLVALGAAQAAVVTTPPPPEAPAPVYIKPLDVQPAAAPTPQTPATDDVYARVATTLGAMRKLGMLAASALLLLFGSAVAGVLLALLITAIRRRRTA